MPSLPNLPPPRSTMVLCSTAFTLAGCSARPSVCSQQHCRSSSCAMAPLPCKIFLKRRLCRQFVCSYASQNSRWVKDECREARQSQIEDERAYLQLRQNVYKPRRFAKLVLFQRCLAKHGVHSTPYPLKLRLQSATLQHPSQAGFTGQDLWKLSLTQNSLWTFRMDTLQIFSISDIVTIALSLPKGIVRLKRGKNNWISRYLVCLAPRRLYERDPGKHFHMNASPGRQRWTTTSTVKNYSATSLFVNENGLLL